MRWMGRPIEDPPQVVVCQSDHSMHVWLGGGGGVKGVNE